MPTTTADAVAEATYPAHAYRVLPQRVPWNVKRLRAAYIDGGHEALADEVWDQIYSTARGRATDVWERAALIDWLGRSPRTTSPNGRRSLITTLGRPTPTVVLAANASTSGLVPDRIPPCGGEGGRPRRLVRPVGGAFLRWG